jgi:hypothetical protein
MSVGGGLQGLGSTQRGRAVLQGRAVRVIYGQVHHFVLLLAWRIVLLIRVLLRLFPQELFAHLEVRQLHAGRLSQRLELVQLSTDLQGDALVMRP